MKILITGVYGFVGYNIFLKLKKDFNVIGIGRKKNTVNNIYKKKLFNKKISLSSLIKLNFQPDLILHCAGSGSVKNSFYKKKLDYEKNVVTTKEILKYINYLEKKPRVIFFSSAAVYGNHCGKYNKKVRPISPYGKHKLLSENILQKGSKELKFKLNILRFFSIYGPGLKKQLIWDACKKINYKENIFFGTGNEKRSWINIQDVTGIIKFLINKKKINNKTLDVSGGDVVKNKVLLEKLYNINDINIKPKFNNINKKGDPLNQIFNSSKLKKFGWSSKIKLFQGLSEYSKWFKKNQKI